MGQCHLSTLQGGGRKGRPRYCAAAGRRQYRRLARWRQLRGGGSLQIQTLPAGGASHHPSITHLDCANCLNVRSLEKPLPCPAAAARLSTAECVGAAIAPLPATARNLQSRPCGRVE